MPGRDQIRPEWVLSLVELSKLVAGVLHFKEGLVWTIQAIVGV